MKKKQSTPGVAELVSAIDRLTEAVKRIERTQVVTVPVYTPTNDRNTTPCPYPPFQCPPHDGTHFTCNARM